MNKVIAQMSPYEAFGIECGSGWKSLYQPIIDYVTLYNSEHEETDSRIYIDQIKEKFGGLRFYWSGENLDQETCNILNEMVRKAEDESYKVCETCGTRENVGITVGGWYITCCEDCITKRVQKYGHMVKWRKNGVTYMVDREGKHEIKEIKDE